MSTDILDRALGRSDESASPVISPVRREAPPRRRPAARPATRQAPAALPALRPAVGCAGAVGGRTIERGYRMSRWARLSVTITVLATALVLLFGGPSSSAGGTVGVVSTPGQTVWSIARAEVGPGASPQAVGALVDRIREINGLRASADEVLAPGLTLQVPVG